MAQDSLLHVVQRSSSFLSQPPTAHTRHCDQHKSKNSHRGIHPNTHTHAPQVFSPDWYHCSNLSSRNSRPSLPPFPSRRSVSHDVGVPLCFLLGTDSARLFFLSAIETMACSMTERKTTASLLAQQTQSLKNLHPFLSRSLAPSLPAVMMSRSFFPYLGVVSPFFIRPEALGLDFPSFASFKSVVLLSASVTAFSTFQFHTQASHHSWNESSVCRSRINKSGSEGESGPSSGMMALTDKIENNDSTKRLVNGREWTRKACTIRQPSSRLAETKSVSGELRRWPCRRRGSQGDRPRSTDRSRCPSKRSRASSAKLRTSWTG